MNEIGKSGAHRTFLLRAWREGAGERSWRFSLEDPATRARQGFDGIEGLMTFLDEACPKDAGTQGDPPAATGSRTGRTGRRTRGALPLALAALLSLLSAPLLRAAPPDGPGLLAIGTVVAPPGGLAILPIHARTGGSVPLESISVKVALEPASAVASATFRKSPAAEGRRTIFEARPQATGSSSWLLVLDGPIAPAGPADPEGILVGRI